jgi:hypothetical protein
VGVGGVGVGGAGVGGGGEGGVGGESGEGGEGGEGGDDGDRRDDEVRDGTEERKGDDGSDREKKNADEGPVKMNKVKASTKIQSIARRNIAKKEFQTRKQIRTRRKQAELEEELLHQEEEEKKLQDEELLRAEAEIDSSAPSVRKKQNILTSPPRSQKKKKITSPKIITDLVEKVRRIGKPKVVTITMTDEDKKIVEEADIVRPVELKFLNDFFSASKEQREENVELLNGMFIHFLMLNINETMKEYYNDCLKYTAQKQKQIREDGSMQPMLLRGIHFG